jgi:hypothetical protein
MKTAVIEGVEPAGLDRRLLSTLQLTQSEAHAVWREIILLGIRNESGEIYRAIGISERNSFLAALAQLQALGYAYEVQNANEAQLRFDAVVSAPFVPHHDSLMQ